MTSPRPIQVTLPKGKRVTRNGTHARLTRDTTVTVRSIQPARDGKTRIFWKSGGYPASALVPFTLSSLV